MVASLERRRMSYDEYQDLRESVRAEWVNGEVVVTPSADHRHQTISRRLANLLEAALPDLCVVEAVTTVLPNNRERIPDIIVLGREPDTPYIHDTPLILVEILSPSTRIEDVVHKSPEYLSAGIRQYWLVDPDEPLVDMFESRDGVWRLLARLDDHTPEASVPVPGHGAVGLSLSQILDGPHS